MATTPGAEVIPLFTADDEAGVRPHDQLYGRYVARAAEGGPRDVATTQIRTVPVKLFGGIADGYTVELAGLASEIAVYVDDVQVHAVDARLAVHESPALATSLYRLVNPTGPEEPRYVAPTI